MAKTLTLAKLRRLLEERFGGRLARGKHEENGECCVRELRACALGQRWNDHPDQPEQLMVGSQTDAACQALNDADWDSDYARAQHCLPLALLAQKHAAPDWQLHYDNAVRVQFLAPALLALARITPKITIGADLRRVAASCRVDAMGGAVLFEASSRLDMLTRLIADISNPLQHLVTMADRAVDRLREHVPSSTANAALALAAVLNETTRYNDADQRYTEESNSVRCKYLRRIRRKMFIKAVTLFVACHTGCASTTSQKGSE